MTSAFTSALRQAISTGLWKELRFPCQSPSFVEHMWGAQGRASGSGKEVGGKAREVARKSRRHGRKHLGLKSAPGAAVQWVWPATSPRLLHITHRVIHVLEKYAACQDVLLAFRWWKVEKIYESIRWKIPNLCCRLYGWIYGVKVGWIWVGVTTEQVCGSRSKKNSLTMVRIDN